jgi:hypothetical protein
MKLLKKVIPARYSALPCPFSDGRAYQEDTGIAILITEREYQGNLWLHISMSRYNRYPTWDEIKRIKNELIGEDVRTIMMMPEKRNYINLHPYCFHLYAGEIVDKLPMEGQV